MSNNKDKVYTNTRGNENRTYTEDELMFLINNWSMTRIDNTDVYRCIERKQEKDAKELEVVDLEEVKPRTWFEQGVSEVAKSFETLYAMQQIADERKKYHVGTPDRIVQDVIKKLDIRSTIGVQKYKTTLDDNNYDNFLEHAQEEMLDGALYLQKLIDQRKDDWVYTQSFWTLLKSFLENSDTPEWLRPNRDELLTICNKRLKPQIENL